MNLHHNLLREQRELKRRVAHLRHQQVAHAALPVGDRRQLARQAVQRCRESCLRRRRAENRMQWWALAPQVLKAASVMLIFSLVLSWNYRHWREVSASLEDNSCRPQPVMTPVAAPALTYAGRILVACRTRGCDALQGQWTAGLPDYLRDVSAKSLAPYLAAPNPALTVAAVEQRRDSVFVRYAGDQDLRLTLHLRENGPGQYSLVAVE